MSDHGHFSSYEGHEERRTGKIREAFSGMRRALDGWMLARAPAPPAQGLHHHGPRYFNFPYFCTMCGLEKLGLIDQNWLERNFFVFLLRTLVVGRRQHSELIEIALDKTRFSLRMEMSRLTRDGTAEPISRHQILRHARGQGNIIFPVQLLPTGRIGNLTRLIHTLLYVMTIHTYIHGVKEV